MLNLQSLFFFDVSAVIIMVVLAYLSRHLGEALKIKPYYKLLYITAALVICASGIDIITETVHLNLSFTVSLALRFAASATAFMVCLRYWNWLFAEYFKH